MTMSASQSPVVHIVDDDEAVLRGLKRLLTAAGHNAECHGSAEEFLARSDLDGPGCAVIDLNLPGSNGLHLQSSLATSPASLPVIFLTGQGDLATGIAAMKGGAVDFLTKPAEPCALLEAVRQALEKNRTDRAARDAEAAVDTAMGCLTPRERQVLQGIVAGLLNKQIAAELGVAEKTVKVHRGRVMHKLGARTAAELVRLVVGRPGAHALL